MNASAYQSVLPLVESLNHDERAWAKFVGVVVLLAPAPARLKEWACAGFAITLVSELVAHLSVGAVGAH